MKDTSDTTRLPIFILLGVMKDTSDTTRLPSLHDCGDTTMTSIYESHYDDGYLRITLQ